ncbi:Spy/CpxP family protein refolding chaperone [Candidatus Omnitrophota bacterium]
MTRRFVAVMFLVFAFIFTMLSSESYAETHGKMKGHGGGLETKFSYKAGLILKNQEDLGLSDEQAKKIKELKIATKKDLIRKKADIDILAIDIKSKLWEETVDINAINALIDKKYEIKKIKAKSLIAACAALKEILTKEQVKKLRTLYGKCKE